ncbi:AraC family transcriptional regulator [Compostibacter hankyongensis]
MKAILQKVPVTSDTSFAVQEFRSPYFSLPWHFHPECELVLITQGTGKRFVGDHIACFEPGDLVLLGPNLPHWYRSDAAYYEDNPELRAASLVIQFPPDFAGGSFLELPEAEDIGELLKKAVLGVEILGKTRRSVISMMQTLCNLKGMDRLLCLLAILNTVSASDEIRALSSPGVTGVQLKDSIRVNRIYEYVMSHYTKPIRLQEVAAVVNMSPSAFCRYFKTRTRKNFILFLNEIRIGHACKLLIEGDYSITEICYMSGYNNVAFFNRQFKALKGKTPKEFRREYLGRFIAG